ncbi:glutathione peroxidase [Armatimonas rosea]|uniref:Glutathione peroxidase n=1 Tax=Armatimonas rosea TaxID=685828 RepID=A0A7W9SSQ6_ARMRO|nr:glutathione peroxidase [Armatimonas rosea]MBB6052026.1 glutathione peroxidase [Armatimonas rosea]
MHPWLRTYVWLAVLLLSTPALARPDYAKKEKVDCGYCHVNIAAGYFTYRGLYYRLHRYSFANFDNVAEARLAGVKPDFVGNDAAPTNPDYPNVKVAPVLNFTMKDILGNPVKLSRYEGSVVLVVNVASKCGNTPQYKSLETLYEKYKDKGLVVLGFPCNDFGAQEPGTEKEIKEFCEATYKVAFPMFSKVAVKGDATAPLYKFLTDKATNPKFSGPIEWNFAKFIIGRHGEILGRVKAGTDPLTPAVVAEIEKALAAK